LSYASDKQTDRQTKQTDSKILPVPTDRVGEANNDDDDDDDDDVYLGKS